MYEPPRCLDPLLWAPGVLYGAAAACRNRLYSAGVLRVRRLSRPVISIGNLTMGGAGKTPLALRTCEIVLKLGATPVLLSRGYGRSTAAAPRISPPGEPSSADAALLGDEPAVVRRRCPDAWVGVDADRYRAARAIEGRCRRPVFILDDGFQHRSLYRDLDIVVIDVTQPFETNRILPRGSLREPLSGLRRADVVLLNGPAGTTVCPGPWLAPGAMILRCTQEISSVVRFEAWMARADDAGAPPRRRPVFLVAAIGNPERFRRDACQAGMEVRGARFFRDHRALDAARWQSCIEEATRAGAAALLTTEKDAVKLDRPPAFPLYVAVQETRMPEQSLLERTLESVVGAGA